MNHSIITLSNHREYREMKESIYTLEVSYNNHWLLYNLLKQTCIILNQEEFRKYKQGLKFEGSDKLSDLGFLIENDYDELDEALYYYQRNIDLRNQNFRKHRVYTTLACNARCPYCFEKGSSRESMSVETAHKVAKYILNTQGNAKRLVVTWFGGEPLLNSRIIDCISSDILSELNDNVEYSSYMITNGILFDSALVEKAVCDWKLEGLQITLDGLKDTYETIKGFSSCNAFERIIENIHLLLLSGINVTIRLNYDRNNLSEILNLIDYLGNEFATFKNLFIYAYRIMSDDCEDNSKRASADTDIIIWDKLYENGFCEDILGSIGSNLVPCTAGSLYNLMFLPNGNLGKCAQAIAKGDIIGNIETGVRNAKVARWCCGVISDNCKKCNLFPACGGGCRYEEFCGKNGCSVSEPLLKHKLHRYLKQVVEHDE